MLVSANAAQLASPLSAAVACGLAHCRDLGEGTALTSLIDGDWSGYPFLSSVMALYDTRFLFAPFFSGCLLVTVGLHGCLPSAAGQVTSPTHLVGIGHILSFLRRDVSKSLLYGYALDIECI